MKSWQDQTCFHLEILALFLTTLMQGTVNVHRFNTLGPLFKAGSMCADVTRSNLSFKLSDSPLSILFSDLTAFVQITTQVNTKLVVLIPTPPSVSLDTMLSLLLLLKSEAVFVDFDREITKLTNIGAAEAGHIRATSIENPKDSQLPLFISILSTLVFASDLHDFSHFQ